MTADGSRYQSLHVVTEIIAERGLITTTTEVAGALAGDRIRPVGETCNTRTTLAIAPGEDAARPGATPLDDVPGQAF